MTFDTVNNWCLLLLLLNKLLMPHDCCLKNLNPISMYFLRPFSLVPPPVESTQLTLWHSSIWQINPWELLDSKRHQPLLNDKSFRLKCWFVAKDPGWKCRTVGKCNVVHVVVSQVNTPRKVSGKIWVVDKKGIRLNGRSKYIIRVLLIKITFSST